MYVCVYVCMYVCMYIYVNIYLCVCVYTLIHAVLLMTFQNHIGSVCVNIFIIIYYIQMLIFFIYSYNCFACTAVKIHSTCTKLLYVNIQLFVQKVNKTPNCMLFVTS